MALPLVVTDAEGRLRIPTEARDLLAGIAEPVTCVAVAGPYRSGKSFLLNCLSPGDGTGGGGGGGGGDGEGPASAAASADISPTFAVGSTTNACTRGLWLHAASSAVRGADGGPLRVLWLDSEGLGAVGCDQQHDLHIFSLAVLASSLFVFNSRGAIDEASIASLSFITQLAKNIHVKSSGASADPDEFGAVFPPFLWVLRDFALQLNDKSGNPISERQYLEESLKREIGFDEAVTSRNRIRMMLTAFFQQRDCVGLQRPLIDELQLAQLSGSQPVPQASLRPGFVKQLAHLRGKIGGMLRPKMLHGAPLTGAMFGTLLDEYVRSINAGQVPNVEGGWKAVLIVQSQKALARALEVFAGALLAAADTARDAAGELPLSQEAVARVRAQAHTAARERMAADMLQPEPATAAALEAGMAERWAAFESVNRGEWMTRSRATLSALWAPVQDRISWGAVHPLSSWGEMQQAWRAVQAEFRASLGEGTVDGDAVINEFGTRVVLMDAGEMLRAKLGIVEEELAESRAQCSRGEAALSAAVAAHAQSVSQSSSVGSAQERVLQDQVASLGAALRIAETALVVQRGENEAEIVELRLRSEFRDKEVSRLNQVIDRLQEKTHAHVTAMNKELRGSNQKCAAQGERLAVMGERLRVAESALTEAGDGRRLRAAAMRGDEQDATYVGTLDVRAQLAEAEAELTQSKQQLRKTTDALRQAKARLQLQAAESSVTDARTQGEAQAAEERAESMTEELRQTQAKAAQLEGEVRAVRSEATALAAENRALREQLENVMFSPLPDEDDDDLEGTPRAGELVV